MNNQPYSEYALQIPLSIELCGRCLKHRLRELQGKPWCYQCGSTEPGIIYVRSVKEEALMQPVIYTGRTVPVFTPPTFHICIRPGSGLQHETDDYNTLHLTTCPHYLASREEQT